MNNSYILAVDQGTTSTRAMLFDREGTVAGWHRRTHEQIFPNPGWVSHNANEIYFNVVETGRRAMEAAGVTPGEVLAVGITNQRETVVLWDKLTGEPVCDAVVWQCRRTAEICRQMEADGMAGAVHEKTGLLIDPYFSATKIKWMLAHYPQARQLMSQGRLLAGTMDSFLIWKLTGGKRHVTDYTNASRTMLFNIRELAWDAELLSYFGIDRAIMPETVSCAGTVGYVDPSVWGASIPITGIAGDQHAALFGQTCLDVGDLKNTYGTGCFLLKNIGSEPPVNDSRLLTTLAWHMDGRATYALEGSVFNAGAAVEWLMKEAKLADTVDEINAICAETPDTNGAYFVPAFSGLGAPFWDMYARGTLCGMSLSTNKRHIVRAVMEAVAFQSYDVIDYMTKTSGIPLPVLRVDGGVCKSDFTMQFQADLLQTAVERPCVTETTAQGAFYFAGFGAGLFREPSDVKRLRKIDRVFEPSVPKEEMDERCRLWHKAVKKAQNWAD